MNPSQRKHYWIRKESDSHSNLISNFRDATQREFDSLVAIFDNQPAVYPPTGARTNETLQIAYHFYSQCYNVPTIKYGYPKGAITTIDTFLSESVVSHSSLHSNRICLLLGNVGCGKTAFINYLITLKGPHLVANDNFWFVRLDIDGASNGNHLEMPELLKHLIIKVCTIIRRNDFCNGVQGSLSHEAKNLLTELRKKLTSKADEVQYLELKRALTMV